MRSNLINFISDVDLEQFWNYSFDEAGQGDLPSVIDHIRTTAEVEQIFYVGHSMGGAMYAVCMTERPGAELIKYYIYSKLDMTFTDRSNSKYNILDSFS
jgi:predicted alpha/beta hydrolase